MFSKRGRAKKPFRNASERACISTLVILEFQLEQGNMIYQLKIRIFNWNIGVKTGIIFRSLYAQLRPLNQRPKNGCWRTHVKRWKRTRRGVWVARRSGPVPDQFHRRLLSHGKSNATPSSVKMTKLKSM